MVMSSRDEIVTMRCEVVKTDSGTMTEGLEIGTLRCGVRRKMSEVVAVASEIVAAGSEIVKTAPGRRISRRLNGFNGFNPFNPLNLRLISYPTDARILLKVSLGRIAFAASSRFGE